MEDLILPSNSCPIEINKGVRGGIRIRYDNAGYEIDIRQANGDVEYMYCNKQTSIITFKPYLAIMAFNREFVNDIDLLAIYVKNRDPREYSNKQDNENERLTFLVKKNNKGIDEKNMHPHDLLSASIRDEYKKKMLSAGILINPDTDDQFEILFKYYETLLKF